MSRPAPSLARSAGEVGALTAASRVLGMVRDQLIAARLGTTLEASAFVIAFTVPNLFRRLFGEGALSASFLPRFVRCREHRGDAEAWTLARRVSTRIALLLAAVCGLGVVLALLLPVFVPAIGTKARLILRLSEIMLPYTFFICLAGVAMGVLNALHHYTTPAAAQMVLNVVMIAALTALCPIWPEDRAVQVHVLAWAVLAAGVVQLGMQVPALRAHGWRPGWDTGRADPETSAVLTALVPAAVGAAVTQINLLLDRLMAGWVGPQAPAALYFSERLVYLPLGVFAVAAGQVLLPSLSRLAARQENERIRETVALSVSMMAFLMLPAAAGLAALAFPITQTLYGFGAFDAESVFHTATALAAYAPALFMFSLDKVFVPVFLAHHDSRTPLFAGLASVGLNLLLNLGCLIWAPDRWKHAMIALTTVIAHAVYIATLARRTHRLCGDCGWVRQISALLRCGAASTLMAACAWSVQRWIAGLAGPGKAGQVVATLLAVLAGMAVYAMVAAVFRFPEWRSLTGRLKKSGAG